MNKIRTSDDTSKHLDNNMVVIFVVMCVLSSFILMHFMTTYRERERERERNSSRNLKIKQKKQCMALVFADFCRSSVVNEFFYRISLSSNNTNNRIVVGHLSEKKKFYINRSTFLPITQRKLWRRTKNPPRLLHQ